MPVRTLVVWCPDWPVVAAGRADQPAVVVAAGRVVACSAAARAEGVRRGLRRRQAEACCSGLVVVASDEGRDARAFEPVAAAVEVFVPAVEIVRPGVCALATRGPSRYFGGDETLAARVRHAVEAIAPCRIGVADGPFAAELAARRGACVPAGETVAFLAPFPVDVLERPAPCPNGMAALSDLLVRLGVRTLGDLAALPADAVLARFGTDGVVAHRLARGLDERPVAARVPPPDLDASIELDPPAERVEAAAFAARTLAVELHAALAARGLACTRVRIDAETEHGESRSRLWRHDGSLTADALAERVRWQLDGWLTHDGGTSGGLTLVRLVPDEVRADDGRQLGFWGGDRAAAERAERTVVRLQGMLGPDAVTAAVPAGGRSPADAIRLVPWGDPLPVNSRNWGAEAPHSRAEAQESEPWPGRVPPPSPATVHAASLPAEVVDGAGAPVAVTARMAATGVPARVSVGGGAWTDVVAWVGPWPVDERWWDPPARRRRVRWQVVTADGLARLLALEGGRWSVEATYD